MEINDSNLTVLSGYLLQTLSPDAATRKTGKHRYSSTKTLAFMQFSFSSGEIPRAAGDQPELSAAPPEHGGSR